MAAPCCSQAPKAAPVAAAEQGKTAADGGMFRA